MAASTLEETLKSLPRLLKEREDELVEKEKEVQRLKDLVEAQLPPSLASSSSSDVIRINVGGTKIIDVRRRTMTQVEGSLLQSMFSGRWEDSLEKDQDGRIFIDHPPHLFLPMVDFLRSIASETPMTETTQPPMFYDNSNKDVNKKNERDFKTMVEYFGVTLGIYRIAIYQVTSFYEKSMVGPAPGLRVGNTADGMNYDIDTDEWETYCLLPLEDTHGRYVKSYEVTLGTSCSAIQIGWVVWEGNNSSKTKAYFDSEGGRGVGYGNYSISIDCVRRGIAYSGEFSPFEFDKTIGTMSSGSVLRTESFGKEWYLDGELIASETKTKKKNGSGDDNTGENGSSKILPILSAAKAGDTFSTYGHRIVPCISIKGQCRISTIELEK